VLQNVIQLSWWPTEGSSFLETTAVGSMLPVPPHGTGDGDGDGVDDGGDDDDGDGVDDGGDDDGDGGGDDEGDGDDDTGRLLLGLG